MFHKMKDKNLRRGPCPPNPPRFSTIPMSSSPPAFTWVVTIIRTSFERIYPKEDDDLPLFHLVDDCAQPLPSCWFCWHRSSSAARVPTRRDCLANICWCCWVFLQNFTSIFIHFQLGHPQCFYLHLFCVIIMHQVLWVSLAQKCFSFQGKCFEHFLEVLKEYV